MLTLKGKQLTVNFMIFNPQFLRDLTFRHCPKVMEVSIHNVFHIPKGLVRKSVNWPRMGD